MKNAERIITSLLLIIAIFVTALSLYSCDEKPSDVVTGAVTETPTSTGSVEIDNSTVEDVVTHKIIENGIANYTVVRPENATDAVVQQIVSLFNLIKSFSDQAPEFTNDYSVEYLKTGAHDPEKYEIILGQTNYDETAVVYEDLGYGEYRIDVIGRKILIVSWSDSGMASAVSDFSAILTSAYDSATKSITIDSSAIVGSKVIDEELNSFPTYEGSNLSTIYDCGDESNMLIFNKTTEESFTKYVNNLNDAGYKTYAQNDMNSNKFATCISDDLIVNVIFTPADKKTRVIYDHRDKISLPENNDSYTKVCDTILLQIGTSPLDNDQQNGECYLIRLEDGRFIVYDGGFSSNANGTTPRNNAKRIYETILEYTPTGVSPTIAAWVFTHNHGDHTGAFLTFAANYSSRVAVDAFIYNFPSESQYESASLKISNYTNVINAINNNYSTTAFVKAHPGQVFQLANVKLEVLYSLELYAPSNLTYFNTSSIVTRLYIGDQTVMMPGDMSEDANAICCKHYQNYLKSDLYQTTHHGYQGGSTVFNRYVDPTWVLWPIGARAYPSLSANARSEYLVSSPNVQKIFVAEFKTTLINFPFDGTNYSVYDNK